MSEKLIVDNLTYTSDMIRRMESAHAREHEELEQWKLAYKDLEGKAIEQSEYIQSKGLTEFEFEKLKGEIADLQKNLSIVEGFYAASKNEIERLRETRTITKWMYWDAERKEWAESAPKKAERNH